MTATAAQIQKLDDLDRAVREAKAIGFGDQVAMTVKRRPKPDAVRIRVLPGVMGKLVQWGDGTDRMLTVAMVKIADMERFIALCRESLAWIDD